MPLSRVFHHLELHLFLEAAHLHCSSDYFICDVSSLTGSRESRGFIDYLVCLASVTFFPAFCILDRDQSLLCFSKASSDFLASCSEQLLNFINVLMRKHITYQFQFSAPPFSEFLAAQVSNFWALLLRKLPKSLMVLKIRYWSFSWMALILSLAPRSIKYSEWNGSPNCEILTLSFVVQLASAVLKCLIHSFIHSLNFQFICESINLQLVILFY